jgi:nucleoid-associated protein YgaU
VTLEKLMIDYGSGETRASLKALFNPDQLVFKRSANWGASDAARAEGMSVLKFQGNRQTTLALDLFFDTYDTPDAESLWWPGSLLPFTPEGRNAPSNVLTQTHALERLTRPDRELHEPPTCMLRWGRTSLFCGVLAEATTTVTLFLPDGTPVRATVRCSFTAREVAMSPAKELHSADVAKKYTVKPGDTLMLIAASMYTDARRWRPIASANALDDPLRLTPGQVLLIPKLRG